MGIPTTARRWTRDAVLALPDDGQRYELLDGELLVSPSPRGAHQRAVLELALLLGPWVRAQRVGALALSPADLDFGGGQLLQPDLFVGAMRNGREQVEWRDFGIPILVIEVISPATARYDRVIKRRWYQHAGVPVYWVVDLDARIVEVWTPEVDVPTIAVDELSWQPALAREPLAFGLRELFERVLVDG
jgi:Uma2 family endonuclease